MFNVEKVYVTVMIILCWSDHGSEIIFPSPKRLLVAKTILYLERGVACSVCVCACMRACYACSITRETNMYSQSCIHSIYNTYIAIE